MTFLKQGALFAVGICAGAVVAAGLFAFVVTIGVVTRIIAKSHTSEKSRIYEDFIAAGAAAGNLYYFFQWPLPGGPVLLAVFGLFSGIYVGSLVMALAETVDAIPVMSRRLRLTVGLQYLILSVAVGKALGSFAYFACGFVP